MIAFMFWICIGIIIYTYAGYPILLTLLAQTRKKPSFLSPYEPTVTLLITAYNEEACLQGKLDNALELHYPIEKLQILVANDGSEDHTLEIAQSYANKGVELSHQSTRQGKMAAMNRAMDLARGEIVVFSDANNLYEPGTLRALISPFSDPMVGCVGGARHIIKGEDSLSESEGLYWKYESFINEQETRLGSCITASGDIFAIRRSLYEPAPKGIINDDFYLAMRLLRRGYRFIYSPQARSFERISLTAKDEITRRTRITAGRYQALGMSPQLLPINRPLLIWQIISHKFFRLFIPFAMLGALIANLTALFPASEQQSSSLFQLSLPFNWIFVVLQSIFYLMAWVGNKTKPAGKIGKILYLPTFLVNSNLAALQGFIRFSSGNQTALWKRVRRAGEGEDRPG